MHQACKQTAWEKLKPSAIEKLNDNAFSVDADIASALEILFDREDEHFSTPRRGMPKVLAQTGQQVFLIYSADDPGDEMVLMGTVKDFTGLMLSIAEYAGCTPEETRSLVESQSFLQIRGGSTSRQHPNNDFSYEDYYSVTERSTYAGATFVQ